MSALRWIGGVVVGGVVALTVSCTTDLSIGIAERALRSPTATARDVDALEARPQPPSAALTPAAPLPPAPPPPRAAPVTPGRAVSPTPSAPIATAGATVPPMTPEPDSEVAIPMSMDFAMAAPAPSIAEASAGWTLLIAAVASVLGGLVAATIARRYSWQYGALAAWTIWAPAVVNGWASLRGTGFASAVGVVAVALTCGGFGAWLRRP